MVKKAVFQGSALAAFFLGAGVAFSQVDFLKLFNGDNAGDRSEYKLGKIFWESIEEEEVVTNDSVNSGVRKLLDRIAEKNGIEKDSIKLHIIRKDEVNAFAMPGNHMVVYTGLITESKNEAELCGVLGHELAHLEKNHVMKKLAKEIGLAVLLQMATGGQGSEMVGESVRMLSSSAYDRKLESEADRASVEYLVRAGIDPSPFADFLYRMAQGADVPNAVYWVSTHPESAERAKAVLKFASGKKVVKKQVLTAAEWEAIQRILAE